MLALVQLALAAPAVAHIALYHPSMCGFQAGNPDASNAVQPLSQRPFSEWWWHAFNSPVPPAAGQFMELPTSGRFVGQVACNKVHTTYGRNQAAGNGMACSSGSADFTAGVLHSADQWGIPVNQLKDVKGTGLAIVYESDMTKIKPEDFVVISTNQSSPWKRDVSYEIPAGLRPCPAAGCLCLWGWVHSMKGGGSEMYLAFYRCKVTNANANGAVLPRPVVARKCPFDKRNCTIGAKQAHYWRQKERDNNWQADWDPPYYNAEYGFRDGAQTDLWQVDNGQTWTTKKEIESWQTYTMNPLPSITPR